VIAIVAAGDPTRLIYLDGRRHPNDPNPTWIGHSIGHWEGDTLVVDTVGFNDRSWTDLNRGYPLTEKAHIFERFRRPDMGHLELEVTIDDPAAFKGPWTMKKTTQLFLPGEEMMEFVCNENERDAVHLVGK